jgi:hypothetical protein
MIDRLQFTVRNTAPTEAPPRVPYIWYHKISATEGDYYLASGTTDVSDWTRISIDVDHPTRTDNPHNVTAVQLGIDPNSSIWNANKILGRPITTHIEPKGYYQWSGTQWEIALSGLAYTNYFATDQKYILDILSSSQGDIEHFYTGFVDDQIYGNIRASAKNLAQWNANKLQDATVSLSDQGEPSALIYDADGDIIETVAVSQLISKTIYHAYQPQEYNTTTQTHAELIPTTDYDHDGSLTIDNAGLFDDATIGGWVIVNADCKLKFDFSATLQNTTTADGTGKVFLLKADYNPDTEVITTEAIVYAEAIATSTNTANRYQTVSKSGIVEMTAGQLISLRFANNLAVSNNIRVKDGSAILMLERV